MIKFIFELIFFIAIVSTMIGCGYKEKRLDVKTIDKIVIVTPPLELLREYPIPKPASKEVYLNSSITDRERICTKYNIQLMTTLGKYKNNTKSLKSWTDKNKQKE